MTNDLKEDIKAKKEQGIFSVIQEVQVKKLVDKFMIELGKQEDANAQWFVIRYELAKMDNKVSRNLNIIAIQLFVLSILGLILTVVIFLLK